MKEIALLIVFAIGLPLMGLAQGLGNSKLLQQRQNENDEQKEKREVPLIKNRDISGTNTYAAKSVLQTTTDMSVAYYQYVTKQNGWFVGIGPTLSKEEASHLNVVYKLSNKNRAGHWMKVEAINGYGDLTTEHDITAYISSYDIKNDTIIDKEWQAKNDQVCQWELMSDGSGEKVIIERAYDKDDNLIYNYQPVYISKNEIIGSITDSWGLPAKTYKRNGKVESIFVNILLDKWGNDSIIKYVDAEGNLLQNSTGSWIEKRLCDKNGIIFEEYSLNHLGTPVNDIRGYCLCKAERDHHGNITQIDYYDAGGNPIRISNEQSFRDVASIRFKYDRWHRMLSQSFFDGIKPDTTSQGVHKIEFTYNNHGQILSIKYRSLNNEPRTFEKPKLAYDYRTYDTKGRLLSQTFLDADSSFIKSNYYCKRIFQYEGHNLKQERDFIFNGSDTVLWHFESFSPQVNTCYHYQDSAYIDSLDVRGNILSRTFISPYQDPLLLPNRSPVWHSPYSIRKTSYQYSPNKCTEITTYFNHEGKWRNENGYKSAAHKIITTDSLMHTISHTEYDKDSVLLANYQEFYDDHFSTLKYKQSLTKTGGFGRSGFTDALYFKAKVEYTPTGNVASIQYLNEFDEPAYVYNDHSYYCYQINDNGGTPQYYDEYKKPCKKYSSISKSEAVCVELLNEKGKAIGLLDGDILIRYDEWFYDHNNNTNNDLYVKMVFASSKDSIDIWVMRHYPEENNSKIIKLKVKAGKISDLGFTVYNIVLTDMEVIRLLKTYMFFKEGEERAGRTISSIRHTGNHWAHIIKPHIRDGKSITPALILSEKSMGIIGWPSSSEQKLYCYGDGYPDFYSIEAISTLSEDGSQIHLDSINNYLGKVYVNLTDEEHRIALKLLHQAKQEFPNGFVSDKEEDIQHTLWSQPSQNAVSTDEMIMELKNSIGYEQRGEKHNILNHVEGIDSTKMIKVYTYLSSYATQYRNLTYQLDKNYYTSHIIPKDTSEIAEKGVVFIHTMPIGIDEILFMSKDTIVWAKGCMPFASEEIIRKNLYGEAYNPSDQYSQKDLKISDNPRRYQIASFWHTHKVYEKSIHLLRLLCKQKFGPAYTLLAEAYTKGEGVVADTVRAMSLYKKALKTGEHVQKSLGQLYYESHQYGHALLYLKDIIDTDACYIIGSIYENGGFGVSVDLYSAFYYYCKGELLAKDEDFSVRRKFYKSKERISSKINYKPDDFKELISSTACLLSADSLYKIGCLYDIFGDRKIAYSYFKAAADSLHPGAEVKMAAYIIGFRFNDQKMAYEYLQRAVQHYLEYAKKGDSSAYFSIAELYREWDVEGNGKDIKKAIYYYKMGMEHGHVLSATELGNTYYKQFDFENALKVYLLGAKAGNTDCMYQAASLYELGASGLEGNIFQAIYWYRQCYNTIAKTEEKSRLSQNALQRLGVPLAQKTDMNEMVGVWISQTSANKLGKVFLPNGKYFGFRYSGDNCISEIRERTFTPWMLGDYYLKDKNHYVEDVKVRDNPSFLGEQELTVRIDGGIMYNTWQGSPESWKKADDDKGVIDFIMQNWKAYSDYMTNNLRYKSAN